jgi:peptide/nickel transport system substrate-binding protein
MLNTAEGEQNAPNPFTNVHARRALAYATDRQAIVDVLGGGDIKSDTQNYRSDSSWGLPDDKTGYYDYDPAKAKEEIEAYKRETGRSELSFNLTGFPGVDASRVTQVLEAQWAAAGITVKLDNVDQVKYITLVALGLYQATVWRWYSNPNPDANEISISRITKPIGELSVNFSHYTSDRMDKNVDIGRTSDDLAERQAAYRDIALETNEQALNIWLYDTPYSIIADKRVRGLNIFRTRRFGNLTAKPWWGEVWVTG